MSARSYGFRPGTGSQRTSLRTLCVRGILAGKKRPCRLEELKDEVRTMVFYEAPHKLLRTLEDLAGAFGPQREVCVSREISKLHEEHFRGTLEQALAHFSQRGPKGEFVLVVRGADLSKEEKRKKINKKNGQKVASETSTIGRTNSSPGCDVEGGEGFGEAAGAKRYRDL